jgi:hypothetical protein
MNEKLRERNIENHAFFYGLGVRLCIAGGGILEKYIYTRF